MSTISAIATSLGTSGINIIRISGENSKQIISKIFTNYSKLSPNSIIYGKIKDGKEILDEVLVSYFKAPNSYTGEDIIEINCHGGTCITRQMLDLVLKTGARLALPGEFSKRAFLNGKMDLSKAESVIDIINSKTKLETKIAANNLENKLYCTINELREKIIELLAHIEVSVDYPEYDYEEVQMEYVKSFLNDEIAKLSKISSTYNEGKYIKNGVNVAILGSPNVGKSSLLNALAGYDRAIVTDIAGTTRDIVEESINIGDIILNVKDTAGIRYTNDKIEKIGVEKSKKIVKEVELVIYMFSVDNEVTSEDIQILNIIKNKKINHIVLLNKTDKTSDNAEYITNLNKQIKEILEDEEIIQTSIKDSKGINLLKEKISHMYLNDQLNATNEVIIVNERHKNLLDMAIQNLNNALYNTNEELPIDIISIELKEAARKLGEIIGKDVSSDVINKIFEKFCLGK